MSFETHPTHRDMNVGADTKPTNPEFRQFGAGIATAAPLDVSVYRAATLTPAPLNDALAHAAEAGLADPASLTDFRRQLTVTTEARGTSSLMTIAVRDEDPLRATTLADAVASAAVAWDRARARSAVDNLVNSLTMQIAALDQQIAELRARNDVSADQITGRVNLRAEQQEQPYYARVLSGSASGLLLVLQQAELPVSPVAPRPVLNAALAAVLAITLVLLLGLLRDLLDTRLRSIDQVTGLTNLPLLAAFPRLEDESRTAPREASNFLHVNLGFALANVHPKVIAVTSASPGAAGMHHRLRDRGGREAAALEPATGGEHARRAQPCRGDVGGDGGDACAGGVEG